MKLRYLLLFPIALFISACDKAPEQKMPDAGQTAGAVAPATQAPAATDVQAGSAETVSATMLSFQEMEQGMEPYLTRMLVTDKYIRIDQGDGSEGYVLFDRENKRIYSVLHDSEQILVVDPIKPLSATPGDLKLREEVMEDKDMPLVGGIQPKHYQFYANDTLCYHVIAIDGFLPEVARALISYQTVLAAQQEETIDTTPVELQTPCYRANYVYAAIRYVSKGFPFEQWDIEGYRRSLVDYEEGKKVDRRLFALPDGYGFFTIGGPVGGTIM